MQINGRERSFIIHFTLLPARPGQFSKDRRTPHRLCRRGKMDICLVQCLTILGCELAAYDGGTLHFICQRFNSDDPRRTCRLPSVFCTSIPAEGESTTPCLNSHRQRK